jgi:cytochrome c peroxidase
VRYATSLFWDGRSPNLESQVRLPLLSAAEHGLADEGSVTAIVGADSGYAGAFEHLFGIDRRAISLQEIATALAAYERTLLAGDSPFDRYMYGGDKNALSNAAVRGLALFRGRAQCSGCHTIDPTDALFSDGEFHPSPVRLRDSTLARLGSLARQVATLRQSGQIDALNALITTDRDISALGRFVVTLNPDDIGRFKTPSLRNVALNGPYMHDGSVKTLPEAVEIELYSRSTHNYPLVLTEDERADLLAFLNELSSP